MTVRLAPSEMSSFGQDLNIVEVAVFVRTSPPLVGVSALQYTPSIQHSDARPSGKRVTPHDLRWCWLPPMHRATTVHELLVRLVISCAPCPEAHQTGCQRSLPPPP